MPKTKIAADVYSSHAKHYVSVDCVIFGYDAGKLKLLLGKRKMRPGNGEWSLYGGFVRTDEDIHMAAVRVVHSLTGLSHINLTQLHAFGIVDRDPGGRVISVVYYTLLNIPACDNDMLVSMGSEWIDIDKVPDLYADHNEMVQRALFELRLHMWSFPLTDNYFPEEFTLGDMQAVFEAVLGKSIDKRNFRKKIDSLGILECTGVKDMSTSKKGSYLYRVRVPEGFGPNF